MSIFTKSIAAILFLGVIILTPYGATAQVAKVPQAPAPAMPPFPSASWLPLRI